MIKLLGSGGYGCVINKSIKNKSYISNYVGDVTKNKFKNDEKKNKHISKIFADTEAYCEELIIITKILYKYHKIFNSIQLFNELSLPPKKCSSYLLFSNINNYQDNEKKNLVLSKLRKFFKENEKNLETHDEKKETISECLIDKFNKDIKDIKIHEIIYDYGGIQLDNIDINDYDFIKALIILCKSLQTLHQLGFVHRDIKPPNILYNNDNNKLSLIDFGVCIPLNEVYTNEQKWWVESEYFISPPEYTLIDKYNKYKNLNIVHTLYKNDDFYIKKKNEYDVFFNKFNNINNIEDIPEEIKKIAYKGDIYSLGITLLLLYNNNNIKITHDNKELIMQKMSSLINNMIITDPFDRYDLTNVINDLFELEKLYIYEIELNKYNDITCNDDIKNITNILSLLKVKGGGKIKSRKTKKTIKKLYKKPLKKILF